MPQLRSGFFGGERGLSKDINERLRYIPIDALLIYLFLCVLLTGLAPKRLISTRGWLRRSFKSSSENSFAGAKVARFRNNVPSLYSCMSM